MDQFATGSGTLEIIQKPLLTSFIQTGQAVDACSNDPVRLKMLFESLLLMSRIFFSLNYQDLPEFFEDHFGQWMEAFAKYLQYNNPLLVDNSEENDPSPVDRLQAALVDNLKLYADKDEEEFIPFQVFKLADWQEIAQWSLPGYIHTVNKNILTISIFRTQLFQLTTTHVSFKSNSSSPMCRA